MLALTNSTLRSFLETDLNISPNPPRSVTRQQVWEKILSSPYFRQRPKRLKVRIHWTLLLSTLASEADRIPGFWKPAKNSSSYWLKSQVAIAKVSSQNSNHTKRKMQLRCLWMRQISTMRVPASAYSCSDWLLWKIYSVQLTAVPLCDFGRHQDAIRAIASLAISGPAAWKAEALGNRASWEDIHAL